MARVRQDTAPWRQPVDSVGAVVEVAHRGTVRKVAVLHLCEDAEEVSMEGARGRFKQPTVGARGAPV